MSGLADTSLGLAEKTRKEGQEELDEQKLQQYHEETCANLELEQSSMQAHAAKRSAEQRRQSLKIMKDALGVDLEAENKLKKASHRRGLTMLVFFLVLSGIELDLIGFVGSSTVYWHLQNRDCPHYGQHISSFNVTSYRDETNLTLSEYQDAMEHCDIWMLRLFIILMPIAYLLTALAYMFLLDADADSHPAHFVGDLFTDETPAAAQASGYGDQLQSMLVMSGGGQAPAAAAPSASPVSRECALAMKVRPPVKLSWCHFIPLYRFTMIIRPVDENDIEGVFRVNSLSSFTLGTAQMLGMMFTFINFDGDFSDLNMFVYLNMFSQLVNWSITILFYATSVSRTMANLITVEAYNANIHDLLQDEHLWFVAAVAQKASQLALLGDADDVPVTAADKHVKKVEWEVKNMKNLKIDLDCFLPEEIHAIRRVLLQQWAEEYAQC